MYLMATTHDTKRDIAIKRQKAAQDEADRWGEFIRLYDELDGSQERRPAPSERPRRREGTKAEQTQMMAREILRRHSGFISTQSLLETLLSEGDEIGGEDPKATMISRLSRATDIENVRSLGWHLADTAASKDEFSIVEHSKGIPASDADKNGDP